MNIKKIDNKSMFTFETIEMREPVLQDFINAEMISGSMKGFKFIIGLISETCLFDGKKALFEDLLNMRSEDFLSVSEAMELSNQEDLLKD